MTINEYRRVLEDALRCGLRTLTITGGEPLLYKHLTLDLIMLANSLGVRTQLETNGTLIDQEIINALKRTDTSVAISLDGSYAELHEGIRMVKGCFDAAIKGMQLAHSQGIGIEIIMALYRRNQADLLGLLRLVSGLQRGILKINPITAMGRGQIMASRGELLSVLELKEFLATLERESLRMKVHTMIMCEPAFYRLSSIVRHYTGCPGCGFRNILGILADGQISLCGIGYSVPGYTFGNIRDVALEAVWRDHPALQELRRGIPERLEGVCSNCMMLRICEGGCRAHAYMRFGSMTAPSPNCQALYDAGSFPASRLIDQGRATPWPPRRTALPKCFTSPLRQPVTQKDTTVAESA
jgi:SynChlorMet cassette radical SAM/SPASM protein ScmF